MEELETLLKNSLRWEDAFTRYSRSQFLVALLGASEENSSIVANRISGRFQEWIGDRKLHLDCQLMQAEELLTPENQAEE
jgi:GGDEF domain-containing protein